MLKCLLSSLFQIRGTYCWKRIRAVVVVVLFYFFLFNVQCIWMCACVKDQISTMQHDRDKKKKWMTKPQKEHSPCSKLYGNIFLYDVFLHFYTQFLSGWWTVLRELTKKVYFILLGIIHWLSQQTLLSNDEETYVTDWCTISNYLLSYT